MSTSQAVLEIQKLTKHYGGVKALTDAQFRLLPGEHAAIVGDNGASAEGGPEGSYNEMMALNGIIGKADQMMAQKRAEAEAELERQHPGMAKFLKALTGDAPC